MELPEEPTLRPGGNEPPMRRMGEGRPSGPLEANEPPTMRLGWGVRSQVPEVAPLAGDEASTMMYRGEASAASPSPPSPRPTPVPTRSQLRKRLLTGCLSVALVLLGALVGGVGTFFYVSANAADRQVPVTAALPTNPSLVVAISPAYLTQVLQKEVKLPEVPGQIQNIQATIGNDGVITVAGDDQLTLFLGITTTRHVKIRLSPYVKDCQLQMHVLHVDLDGIPAPLSLTTFYSELETQINQQLRISLSGLTQGFTYCTTGVRATPEALIVSYSVTPTPES